MSIVRLSKCFWMNKGKIILWEYVIQNRSCVNLDNEKRKKHYYAISQNDSHFIILFLQFLKPYTVLQGGKSYLSEHRIVWNMGYCPPAKSLLAVLSRKKTENQRNIGHIKKEEHKEKQILPWRWIHAISIVTKILDAFLLQSIQWWDFQA